MSILKNKEKIWTPGSTGFQPVPDGQLIKARRQLPHWQMGGSTYFITFRSTGSHLPPEARKIVLEACCFLNDKKYRLWAAVVMPDHVHLLLTPKEKAQDAFFSLTEILHSLKSFTGNRINKILNRRGILWQ
jgi:putative transposase